MKKDLRDLAVTSLALSTAYGLGILTCVYVELKLISEYHHASKKREDRKSFNKQEGSE